MNSSTYVASAGALLALMAFKQFDRQEAVLRQRPTTVAQVNTSQTLKGTKRTHQATSVSDVVTAANAFLATLSTSQQSTVLQTFNSTNVVKWSNFPIGIYGSRIGIRFDALTSTQLTAALAVLKAATGTTANEGYDEIQQIRAADDNLGANGGGTSNYSSGYYFIAFLGTPSTTGTWMLQYGGHHMATNITYGSGNVTGATPKFEGVEPLSFTTTNANVFATGTTLAPQAQEQAAMLAMISGLSSTQKTSALISGSFGDVVVGPQKDGSFPTTKSGIAVSSLSSSQQALVVAAMAPWVNDVDDATAASLLAYYQTQLSSTYIGYAGTGNFTTQGDYARIDGPNVWIEFCVQNGVVYTSQVHYHTIYRDRARDYGGNFYGSYTTVLGTRAASTSSAAATVFTAFPNPIAGGQGIDVVLAQTTKSATYTLRNSLGQTVVSGVFSGVMTKIPTVGVAAGTYLLSVQPAGETAVTSRVTLQ